MMSKDKRSFRRVYHSRRHQCSSRPRLAGSELWRALQPTLMIQLDRTLQRPSCRKQDCVADANLIAVSLFISAYYITYIYIYPQIITSFPLDLSKCSGHFQHAGLKWWKLLYKYYIFFKIYLPFRPMDPELRGSKRRGDFQPKHIDLMIIQNANAQKVLKVFYFNLPGSSSPFKIAMVL